MNVRSWELPAAVRVTGTLWLLVTLCLFVLGEGLLLRTYRHLDGDPGLSLSDVEIAFTVHSDSLLEARLRTDMREHLEEGDLAVFLRWIREGGGARGYQEGVAALLDDRCTGCHRPGRSAAFRPLETFEQVSQALAEPPSPPTRWMVTTTKTHLLGIALLLAVPSLLVCRSRLPSSLQPLLVSAAYGGLLLDFGCWWLMRWSQLFAGGGFLGHALLVGSLAALCLAALEGLWSREAPAERA